MSSQEVLIETHDWFHDQRSSSIALLVFVSFVVTLRIVGIGFVNWKRKQHFLSSGCDDILIIVSLVTFVSSCACAIVNANAYLAYYSTSASATETLREHYITIYKSSYGFSVIYPIACAMPKLSICCMYLELFQIRASMRKATYAVIVFTMRNAVAWFVPSVAVCRPISAYWTPASQRNCINIAVFGTWISLPNIITDLIIFGLPLPLLWSLQMQRLKKFGLTITFLAGLIGIIGGCLRLAFYIHRTYMEQHPGTTEPPKQIVVANIVSLLEPAMYLVAACFPRLRQLISHAYDMLSSSLSRRYGSTKEHIPSEDPIREDYPDIDVEEKAQGQAELY